MSHEEPGDQASAPGGPVGLSRAERLMAFLVFGLWLAIFAGGVLMDTRPYRVAISPGGVAALEATAGIAAPAVAATAVADPPGLLVSWLVVLVWFLPLNLALLCAVSGVLGAIGNLANLHDDQDRQSGADRTNPFVSALLRGFFVYLIMISGMLLLDDAPFANPSPGQYIRLSGLLSLFSFVVNYNPQVFSRLLVIAASRMQPRDGGRTTEVTRESEVKIERAAVQVTRIQSATETHSAAAAPAHENGAESPAVHRPAADPVPRGTDDPTRR